MPCRLLRQLQADCALLTELRVMDYSLLLGVHYRSPGYQTSPQITDRVRSNGMENPLQRVSAN